ncbi:MAG: pyridoxamine 5'-phosphate oxidase family protein [Lachnospiraceae bacterium]|nr:pyridoxamine 5'-phosphate oxidase family protein [Lachnospiraceae bacterium]
MEEIYEFLKSCGTFYIATIDGDQPRVRPFGALAIIDGKICTASNNTKKVYQQIKANPKVEISGMAGGKWIRFTAECYEDERREAKEEMLEKSPGLKSMYSVDDGIFCVLYFKNVKADICSFTEPVKTIEF